MERYSSSVSMTLTVDGHRYNVARLGPTQLELREEPQFSTPNHGALLITVDGTDSARVVRLLSHEGRMFEID